MAAGPADVDMQPRCLDDPSTASSTDVLEEEVHRGSPKLLQEPAVPQRDVDQRPAPDVVDARSDAAEAGTAQLRHAEHVSGVAKDSAQQGRQEHAQHALPGVSHKWAQYASSSGLSGQQSQNAKPLTTAQASSFPVILLNPGICSASAPAWQHLLGMRCRGADVNARGGLRRPCQQRCRQCTAGR